MGVKRGHSLDIVGLCKKPFFGSPIMPFLKWPGGKRWVAGSLASYIHTRLVGRYYEPFLGGGAVFFALQPRIATLSDINGDLINTYNQVRYNTNRLEEMLKVMPVSKDAYYSIRSKKPRCPIEQAARFLYLNRTAFAGMYRLNGSGEFNVPYGGGTRTPNVLWEKQILETAAKFLRNKKVIKMDFERAMEQAGFGDVVYCDPTYTVAHSLNGFVRYNERNFSWEDQKRLAVAAKAACSRGALVLITNAKHESITKLYSPTKPIVLERKSRICPNAKYRVPVKEYLFLLDPNKM